MSPGKDISLSDSWPMPAAQDAETIRQASKVIAGMAHSKSDLWDLLSLLGIVNGPPGKFEAEEPLDQPESLPEPGKPEEILEEELYQLYDLDVADESVIPDQGLLGKIKKALHG